MKTNNTKGFSLLEIMVGLVIFGILTLTTAQVVQLVNKNNQKVVNFANDQVGVNLNERQLSQDINLAEHSFNNLNFTDDSGKVFMDYFPDFSPVVLSQERVLTLSKKNPNASFFMILQDEALGSSLLYDPVEAYSYSDNNIGIQQSARLTFESLNYKDCIKVQRPNFWNDGHILMLDSAAAVHTIKDITDGVYDQRPPRSGMFIGTVAGSTLKDISPLVFLPDGKRKLLNTASALNSSDTISSADEYLRKMPPMGGGQMMARINAVKIVKYSLEAPVAGQQQVGSNLVRYEWDPQNGFSSSRLIGDRIDSVIFKRSITSNSITFNVVKVRWDQ